ncbi:hypothetical protein F5Y10DRAFT_287650 [Nemania abortiva]|nr:hypothetical protein F5Y10DRAFT_287650 [Nemania abortiva]
MEYLTCYLLFPISGFRAVFVGNSLKPLESFATSSNRGKGSLRQITVIREKPFPVDEMELATTTTPQASADPEQAAIILSSQDAARNESLTEETYPLDSSRFMTQSGERIGTLSSRHQTACILQPLLKPQHLSANTRSLRSYDGSESGYQTSSNGKSPILSTPATFSTAETSPLLSIAQTASDPEPLDLEAQQKDEEGVAFARLEPPRQSEIQTSALGSGDCHSTTRTIDSSHQKRQREASVLHGFGDWIDRDDDLILSANDLSGTDSNGLRTQLYLALVRQNETQNLGFVPESRIYELINPGAVFKELTTALPHNSIQEIQNYTDIICHTTWTQDRRERTTSFRKIFAILVLAKKTDTIPALIRERVSDNDLPLRVNEKLELRRQASSLTERVSHEPLRCFNSWDPTKRLDFLQYQGWMLALVFEEGDYNCVPHYVIHNRCQLPFVPSNNSRQGHESDNGDDAGGFGKVTMVDIHPYHHRFSDKDRSARGFAIKALHDPSRKAFKRERDILSKFKGSNKHENIVTLLATYELSYESRYRFNMIFYRADGNIYRYWEEAKPSPDFNYENMLWVSEQCNGLADGLSQLHKHRTWPYIPPWCNEQGTEASTHRMHLRRASNEDGKIPQFGKHGDIKPENILYYPKPGNVSPTLELCDFGGSELRFRMTGSAKNDPFTITYRAPECDIETNSPDQRADIWSLSCVFLEFVAWLLGGISLVNQFTRDRRSYDVRLEIDADAFFDSDQAGNRKVKDTVTKSIDDFHSHPRCTQYVHEFLHLIQHSMLVIDPAERMECRHLYKRLNSMFEKCQSSEEYATKVVPKSGTSEERSYYRGSSQKSTQAGGSYSARGISELTKLKPTPQLEHISILIREESHLTK